MKIKLKLSISVVLCGWRITISSDEKWVRPWRRRAFITQSLTETAKETDPCYGHVDRVAFGCLRAEKQVFSEIGRLAIKQSDYSFDVAFGGFAFSAIGFDDEEERLLLVEAHRLGAFRGMKNPKVCCHHVTLALGAPEQHPHQFRQLLITHVGRIPGRVSAFRVLGAPDSLNRVPHITIAVAEGASAKDSNLIREWRRLKEPIPIDGRECVFGD